jgi:hypothetical protein
MLPSLLGRSAADELKITGVCCENGCGKLTNNGLSGAQSCGFWKVLMPFALVSGGAMETPSFTVQQKVLQLVVDRIVVEDNRVLIEHVVPTGPVRLQTEQPAAANSIWNVPSFLMSASACNKLTMPYSTAITPGASTGGLILRNQTDSPASPLRSVRIAPQEPRARDGEGGYASPQGLSQPSPHSSIRLPQRILKRVARSKKTICPGVSPCRIGFLDLA